jgi:hypothetical protein
MRIKIIENGWAGYSGPLGTLVFVDGVSTETPSQQERDRFGVNLKICDVDDNGNETEQVSANSDLIRISKLEMPINVPLKSDAQLALENPAPIVDPVAAPDPLPFVAPVEIKDFTREELEKISDDQGIKGLREIGTPLGAKNTSIHKLIDEILEAQTKRSRS